MGAGLPLPVLKFKAAGLAAKAKATSHPGEREPVGEANSILMAGAEVIA
jgi:hypothetical protein